MCSFVDAAACAAKSSNIPCLVSQSFSFSIVDNGLLDKIFLLARYLVKCYSPVVNVGHVCSSLCDSTSVSIFDKRSSSKFHIIRFEFRLVEQTLLFRIFFGINRMQKGCTERFFNAADRISINKETPRCTYAH